MSNILKIDSVSKYYGKLKALNGVSFKIPENSIFAILGPNGSGKSTLIRILANLITSWEGDISFKNNKTILVFAGTSGIGSEICEKFYFSFHFFICLPKKERDEKNFLFEGFIMNKDEE